MNKCARIPAITNDSGENVESKLFSDLLHYTQNDREATKQYYLLSKDREFLDTYAAALSYDKNGEPTFTSFKKVANLKLDKVKLEATLNKELGVNTYPTFNDAINRVQEFNNNNPYNNKYMGTIKVKGKNKYKVILTKNTKLNQIKLTKVVTNQNLLDRIVYYLQNAGMNVAFLDNTQDSTEYANTLKNVITLATEGNMQQEAAEKAGAFVVGALSSSPLMARLKGMVQDPELQKKIMGENVTMFSENEVMAHLVGQALINNIDKKSILRRVLSRIVRLVKTVFAKLSKNDIIQTQIELKTYADQMARGFMSNSFDGNAETAVKFREDIFNAEDSVNVKTLKSIINTLKNQAYEMRALDNGLYEKYNNIVKEVQAGRVLNTSAIFADIIAIDGISEAALLMADLVEDMNVRLNDVNFSDIDISKENAVRLREVSIFVHNAQALLLTLQKATSSIPDSIDKLTNFKGQKQLVENITNAQKELNEAINGDNRLYARLQVKQRNFFFKFLESVHGSNYITKSARVLFGSENKGFLKFKMPEKVNISDLLNTMEKDISSWDLWMSSMANNPDIIGQLADKATKIANKFADDAVIQVQNDLVAKYNNLNKIGLKNTDIFCERNDDGSLSGNILSRAHWGKYETDWDAFRKKSRDEFMANNDLNNKSEFIRSQMWNDFFKPRAKEWHKFHSDWDAEKGLYVPNLRESPELINYLNPKFDDLTKDQQLWLSDLMEMKETLDSLLPQGSTNLVRMPQFKGTTVNKIRNKKLISNTKLSTAVLHTLRQKLSDTFCEDSEDTEYGSEQTYNTLEEDMFTNQLESEREKVNRLPIYGINKMKDISQLSTDLIQSMLAYAGMAYTNHVMNQVVDTLEIGSEVLSRREVEGVRTEITRRETSNAYRRYQKFLDMQVYNIFSPKLKLGKKVVLNKLAGFFTGLASKIYLGGNFLAGAANLGTGAIEIFKESLAGEFYTNKDWQFANKEYLRNLIPNMMQAFEDVKYDKVSLFIKQMNAFNTSKEEHRNMFTRKSKWVKANPLGENLFLFHKSGEHYMQTIAYLATANNIKLRDINGKPISLYNAYQVVDVDPDNPKAGKKLELKEGITKANIDTKEQDMLGSILYKFGDPSELEDFDLETANFTKKEIDYINSLNKDSLMDIYRTISNKYGNNIWSTEDESNFMDKVREVNNRMHGVYNNQDKAAFQKTIIGNMLAAFKKYALGMVERRFGKNKYSHALGGDIEGSAITTFKVMAYAFNDAGNFSDALKMLVLPFSKKSKSRMEEAGFSSNQYANMRRNLGDYAIIAALLLLKMMTAAPDDDDKDDEENYASGLGYYMASRLYAEQSAFNTVWGIFKESRVLSTATPVGLSVCKDLYDLGELILTGEEYKKKGRGYEKGESKWKVKLSRMIPFYRSLHTAEFPYAAAKSYQYGRTGYSSK